MSKKQNIKETIEEIKALLGDNQPQFLKLLEQEQHTNTEEVVIYMMRDMITAISMLQSVQKTAVALSKFLDSIPEDPPYNRIV